MRINVTNERFGDWTARLENREKWNKDSEEKMQETRVLRGTHENRQAEKDIETEVVNEMNF